MPGVYALDNAGYGRGVFFAYVQDMHMLPRAEVEKVDNVRSRNNGGRICSRGDSKYSYELECLGLQQPKAQPDGADMFPVLGVVGTLVNPGDGIVPVFAKKCILYKAEKNKQKAVI